MITVCRVPHKHQRYETIGDWEVGSDGEWFIRVSKMPDWRYEFLVSLHEQIELALCQLRGITDEAVTQFDKGFEAARRPNDDSEPGDHLDAPYWKEHQFATQLERLMADELGVEWIEYERAIERASR